MVKIDPCAIPAFGSPAVMLLAAFVTFEMTGPVKTLNVVRLEVSPPMETEMG